MKIFIKDSVCLRQLRRAQVLKLAEESFNLIPLRLDNCLVPEVFHDVHYLDVDEKDDWWRKFIRAVKRDHLQSYGDKDQITVEANALLHILKSVNMDAVLENLQCPIAKDIGYYLTQGQILKTDPRLKLLASNKTLHTDTFCHSSDLADVQGIATILQRESKVITGVHDRPISVREESKPFRLTEESFSTRTVPGYDLTTINSRVVKMLYADSCEHEYDSMQSMSMPFDVHLEGKTRHHTTSSKTVIMLSPAMVRSPGCQRKVRLLLEQADQDGETGSVIPCRLKNCETPQNLRDVCCVDRGEMLWLDKLARAIQIVNLPGKPSNDKIIMTELSEQFSLLAMELKKVGVQNFREFLESPQIAELIPYFSLGEWFYCLLRTVQKYDMILCNLCLSSLLKNVLNMITAGEINNYALTNFCRRMEILFHMALYAAKPRITFGIVPFPFSSVMHRKFCLDTKSVSFFIEDQIVMRTSGNCLFENASVSEFPLIKWMVFSNDCDIVDHPFAAAFVLYNTRFLIEFLFGGMNQIFHFYSKGNVITFTYSDDCQEALLEYIGRSLFQFKKQ